MKKNLFLTFCFSFIPGAGQMYQNYMKRGLSIMAMFALFLAFSIMIEIPIFILPLPIIFAYSFFDTYNIRNRIEANDKMEDEYIWKQAGLDIFNFDMKMSKKHSIIGIILIVFGFYLIVNNILTDIAYANNIEWLEEFVRYITRYLPAIIISAISIGLGSKFLVNKEK